MWKQQNGQPKILSLELLKQQQPKMVLFSLVLVLVGKEACVGTKAWQEVQTPSQITVEM